METKKKISYSIHMTILNLEIKACILPKCTVVYCTVLSVPDAPVVNVIQTIGDPIPRLKLKRWFRCVGPYLRSGPSVRVARTRLLQSEKHKKFTHVNVTVIGEEPAMDTGKAV